MSKKPWREVRNGVAKDLPDLLCKYLRAFKVTERSPVVVVQY
jgi:hypothetical protein